MTWKEKMIELGMTDKEISHRVARIVKRYEKVEKSITEADNDLAQPGWNKSDIRQIEKVKKDLQKQLLSIDTELIENIQRLHDNKELNAKRTAAIKGAGKKKDDVIDVPPVTKTEEIIEPIQEPPPVSIPIMITADMRALLYGLKYTEQDVDAMKPEEANIIIAEGREKKIEEPTHGWPEKPTELVNTPVSDNQPAKVVPIEKHVPPPARPIPPKPDKPPVAKKKSNTAVVIAACVVSLVLGFFGGRATKNN